MIVMINLLNIDKDKEKENQDKHLMNILLIISLIRLLFLLESLNCPLSNNIHPISLCSNWVIKVFWFLIVS